MKWRQPKWHRALFLGALVLAGFGAGVVASLTFRPVTVVSQTGVDLGPFWKAWGLLDEHFVNTEGSATTSPAALATPQKIWGAIGGLVDAYGDPYSVFLPPEENKQFEEEIRGNFGGLGVEIGLRDDFVTVIAPLPDTPAKRAGLVSGDQIIEIDDQTTFKMSLDEAIALIRGEVGTAVKLKLRSAETRETREVTVIRALIKVPTIETELRPDRIFVIKLFNFSATAPKEFKQALRLFAAAKTDKLIFDLRGNPGGYLNAAIEVASWFLPKTAVVVTEDRGVNEKPVVYYSKGYDAFSDQLKMVVLVDKGSASASEIVAGALQEHGVARLVGEQTFGKGSVQEVFPITSDTALKITVARWLTPKGTSISHNGLKPDLAVKASPATTTPTAKEPADVQLGAAVKLLLKK